MNTEQKCCQKCQGIRNGYLQLVPKIEHRSAFFCKSPKCECHHTEQKWWRKSFAEKFPFTDIYVTHDNRELHLTRYDIESFIERTLQEYQEELVMGVSEILRRAEEDINDAKPFGHSTYGMGVAVGERDAATEILSLIKDTK